MIFSRVTALCKKIDYGSLKDNSITFNNYERLSNIMMKLIL